MATGRLVALFDDTHGQPNWRQTGFPSRQLHSNLVGVTELLCGLGYECRATGGQSLVEALPGCSLLIIPPPAGRYDARRERWSRDADTLFTASELQAVLRFLEQGGCLLAFGYRFGDSFTQTNLGELCQPLGCRLNDDAVIDVRVLRQTNPLHLHFDTPAECLPCPWSRAGVGSVRWRPAATFTMTPGFPMQPLVFSTGGNCLSFDRTLRRIRFDSLALAVAGVHGAGRFALFGGPHLFESSPLGLLAEADNARFLCHVLRWLQSPAAKTSRTPHDLSQPALTPCVERFSRIEGHGDGERTIASVERVLRKAGVLKALSRARWMP
ncbi:MAG TPA: hypothetical protein PLS38_11610 [Solirubrobacterales bacterium]|nr:hypothetical protein [Solirubrobacterales bacterium]